MENATIEALVMTGLDDKQMGRNTEMPPPCLVLDDEKNLDRVLPYKVMRHKEDHGLYLEWEPGLILSGPNPEDALWVLVEVLWKGEVEVENPSDWEVASITEGEHVAWEARVEAEYAAEDTRWKIEQERRMREKAEFQAWQEESVKLASQKTTLSVDSSNKENSKGENKSSPGKPKKHEVVIC